MDGSPIKAEEAADHRKSGYKSWKKKYRKMRIVFDQKMQEGEELHKKEDKASATVKRLAVENEYVPRTKPSHQAQIPMSHRPPPPNRSMLRMKLTNATPAAS